MPGPEHISAKEAHDKLGSGEADAYLDVRSTPEFLQGHPDGAWHVPLLEADPIRGAMQPNPDFVKVVKAALPPGKRIVVGCQSGKRSEQAMLLLLQEGYGQVWNVRGGFGGERDAFGRKVAPSWPELGLPVATGDGGERGYQALKAKA